MIPLGMEIDSDRRKLENACFSSEAIKMNTKLHTAIMSSECKVLTLRLDGTKPHFDSTHCKIHLYLIKIA